MKKEEKEEKERLEKIKNEAPKSETETEPKVEKRGRPKKETIQFDFSTSQIISIIFDIVSKRYGDHWKLTEEEKQNLGKAYDKLLLKYAPYLAKYGVELNCVVITIMAFYPRFLLDIEKAKKEKELGKRLEKRKENAK